jgi:hypothetical protein
MHFLKETRMSALCVVEWRPAGIRAQGPFQIANSRATLRVSQQCSIAKSQESQRGTEHRISEVRAPESPENESHEDDWES